MSDDERRVNTNGLTAHPSRCAAWMPIVRGRCPACRLSSLFLASGGYVTCANLSCGNPTAVNELLGIERAAAAVPTGNEQ